MAGNKVVLFGSEKMAQLCHFFLSNDSSYKVVAFTVDGAYVEAKEAWGLPLIPFEDIERKYPPDEYKMFIAVGYQKLNMVRADKYREARRMGYELISYVSSKSIIWGDVEIGDNCFISENSVIYPWTRIGNNVIIRSSVFVGHDVSIEDHCWISPHSTVNGFVTIGPYCFLGANATLRDEVTIGRECLIGAGSVILKNTKEKEVYIQEPAKLYPLDSSRFVKMTNI
jgi:sugar O-acyltransferase (sialic acid O-acetyltransferase NeuD family)